jgi:hypothetical protein
MFSLKAGSYLGVFSEQISSKNNSHSSTAEGSHIQTNAVTRKV